MTKDEIEALEGVALAEAVAQDVMGWKRLDSEMPYGSYWQASPGVVWLVGSGPAVTGYFRPDSDWNDTVIVMESLYQRGVRFYQEFTKDYFFVIADCREKSSDEGDSSPSIKSTPGNATQSVCRVALCAASELERPA